MQAMLRRLMPKELASLRLANLDAGVEEIAALIEDIEFDAPADRVGRAAATIDRFGRR